MKTAALSLAAVLAIGFMPGAASAAALASQVVQPASPPGSLLLQIHETKRKSGAKQSYRRWKDKKHYGASFIPGYVLTPYGRRDCIGWWHWHGDGWPHCHGQLIKPD